MTAWIRSIAPGLAVLVALGLLAAGARAQEFDAPFQVDADEVEYQADRDVYVARGNVVIRQEGLTLEADRVLFSQRTRDGVATGSVVIRDGDEELRAPFVQFNIDTLRGVVFDGELDSPGGGYILEGKEVRKTGDDTYEFIDGRFTTCRCPKPDARSPWALKAQRASLDIDGYGRARNSTLEILGVPVFWLPYAVYPLKRERETGFLFPQIGTGNRSGGNLTVPFFWAARPDVGVLLQPEYQLRRGFKPAASVDYAFGERGYGVLYGTYIHDKDIQDDPRTPFGKNRYGITLLQKQDLPYDSWLAVDAVTISDNQFPFDFDDFQEFNRDRYLLSTGFAGTSFGGPSDRFGATVAGRGADDLQNPNDQDRDSFLLQRLPEVDLTALPESLPFLPGLVADSNLQLINFKHYDSPDDRFREFPPYGPAGDMRVGDLFWDTGIDAIQTGEERDNNGIQQPFDVHQDDFTARRAGPEGDGEFQEGEPLIDQGQRVIAQPRVAYPFTLGDILEVYPEAGYYGTFYSADLAGFDSRSLFIGRFDLRAKLRGTARLPFRKSLATHLLQPFVSWVGVTQTDQDENPLFVPRTAVPQKRLRLLELDNVILDPADRVAEASDVVFGVTNRWWAQGSGRMLGELTLLSGYQGSEGRWSPAVLQGEFALPYGISGRFQSVMDFATSEFSDGLADLGWSRAGYRVNVRYRYVRDIPQVFENFVRDERFQEFQDNFTRINQLSGGVRVPVLDSWTLTYDGSFSFENAISLVNRFGIEYLSKCHCWAVRLEVDEDRVRGVTWQLRYRIVGLGDQGSQMFRR